MSTRTDYDAQREHGATHEEAARSAANTLLTVLACEPDAQDLAEVVAGFSELVELLLVPAMSWEDIEPPAEVPRD